MRKLQQRDTDSITGAGYKIRSSKGPGQTSAFYKIIIVVKPRTKTNCSIYEGDWRKSLKELRKKKNEELTVLSGEMDEK